MTLVAYISPPLQVLPGEEEQEWAKNTITFKWPAGETTGLHPITNYTYQILLKDDTIVFNGTVPSLGEAIDGLVTFNIEGFPYGTTFKCRVRAMDQSGHWSQWSPSSVEIKREYKIKKPGTIVDIIHEVTDNSLKFSWEQPLFGRTIYNQIDPIIGYNVQIKTTLGDFLSKEITSNSISISFTELEEGEGVQIRVSAIGASVMGDWSSYSIFVYRPFIPTAPQKPGIPNRSVAWHGTLASYSWEDPAPGVTVEGTIDTIKFYNIKIYEELDNELFFIEEISEINSNIFSVSLDRFNEGAVIKIQIQAIGDNNEISPWSDISLGVQKFYSIQNPGPPTLTRDIETWAKNELVFSWQDSQISGNDNKNNPLNFLKYNVEVRAGGSTNPFSNDLVFSSETEEKFHICSLDKIDFGAYIFIRLQSVAESISKELYYSEWGNWSLPYRKFYKTIKPQLYTPVPWERKHGYEAVFNWLEALPGIDNEGNPAFVMKYIVELQEKKKGSEWETINTLETVNLSYTYQMPQKIIGESVAGDEYRIRVGAMFEEELVYPKLEFSESIIRLDSPIIPYINKIGEQTIENNIDLIEDISIGSLIDLALPGGEEGEEDTLYRLKYGGIYTNYKNNLKDFNIDWAAFSGQIIEIQPEAQNNVQTVVGDIYRVLVGKDLTINFLFDEENLNVNSKIQIESTKIDNVFPQVEEKITIFYWKNETQKYQFPLITRKVSNLEKITLIENIFSRIYNNHNDWFLNEDTFQIKFQANYQVGDYFSTTTPIFSTTFLPHNSFIKITHADNSSQFKFPLNNTLPIVNKEAIITWNINTWPENTEGSIRIQKTLAGKNDWITIFEKSITSNITNQTFKYNILNEQEPGETVELRMRIFYHKIGIITSQRIDWNFSNEDLPYTQYRNRIERRILTNPVIEISSKERLNFLTDDLNNMIQLDYLLKWDLGKAYYISSNFIEIHQPGVTPILLSDGTPQGEKRLCFNLIENSKIVESYIYLADSLATDKWYINKIKNLFTETIYNLDPNYVIVNNENINLIYKFQIYECYRNSLSTNIPNHNSLSENFVEVTSEPVVVNTFMLPIFFDNVLNFERAGS